MSGDGGGPLVAAGVRTDLRTELPYIVCPHRALPEEEMTPDRVAAILPLQDVDRHHEAG